MFPSVLDDRTQLNPYILPLEQSIALKQLLKVFLTSLLPSPFETLADFDAIDQCMITIFCMHTSLDLFIWIPTKVNYESTSAFLSTCQYNYTENSNLCFYYSKET